MRKLTAGLVGLVLAVTGVVALPSAARADAGVGPWVVQVASDLETWTSVTYGEGLFVAVASSGADRQVMTSPDGRTWTTRDTPGSNDANWSSVAYGGGLFVAVSNCCTPAVMTSPDGITWTMSGSAPDGAWTSVAFGGGRFVAVAQDNQVMSSADGNNWTVVLPPEDNNWNSVTFGAGTFVAVADGGLGVNEVMTSSDGGLSWTSRAAASDSAWTSVTFGDAQFVAVACDCPGSQVMTSPDGATWTSQAEAESNEWYSVTYGDGLYVAVARDGVNPVMTSPDGVTWTSRDAPDNMWTSVAFGDGVFAAVALTDTTEQVMISYTPTVTTVSPASGLPAGGTSVTITGTFLTGATAVTFGGTAATSFTVNSATSITAVAPAHAVGSVDVVVTTPGGTATKTNGYAYAVPTPDPPPAPTPTPTPTPSPTPVPAPTPAPPAPVLSQESLLVRFTGESSRVTATQRERIQAFVDAQPGVIVSTRIVGFPEDSTRAARVLARERAEATARTLVDAGVPVSRGPGRLLGNGDTDTFPGRAGRVFITVWTVS